MPLPLPDKRFAHYRFVLGWPDAGLFGGFYEATGHDVPARRAGLHKSADVLLRRGLIHDTALADWLDAVRAKQPGARRPVHLMLLDGSSRPMKRWLLDNAWPLKCQPPELKAQGHEVAVDALTLSAESIVAA